MLQYINRAIIYLVHAIFLENLNGIISDGRSFQNKTMEQSARTRKIDERLDETRIPLNGALPQNRKCFQTCYQRITTAKLRSPLIKLKIGGISLQNVVHQIKLTNLCTIANSYLKFVLLIFNKTSYLEE